MHPLDEFKTEMAAYLPGLLVLYDIANAKRINDHLGFRVVDRDIEEMNQLVAASVGPSGLAKRVKDVKWLALYKTDSLAPVAALLSSYHKEQAFLVGWRCTGDRDGINKVAERTVRSTIVRSLRCIYSFTTASQEPVTLIEQMFAHIYRVSPGRPHSLSDAPNADTTGWQCVSSYPNEMPFCPFCERSDFEWEDGDGSYYSGSGTCKTCGAAIDIRGVERSIA